MLEPLRISGWRPLVAALYAVAMLTLGFAHCRLSLPDESTPGAAFAEVAAFALPDGFLPSICGQSKSGAPGRHHGDGPCDVCQLTAAPGAAPTPPQLAEAPRASTKLPPAPAFASVAGTAALEPQSRGPPLSS